MIRAGDALDLDLTWDIYRDAVLNGTAPFYTAAQARAWVGPPERPSWWDARMAAARTWIAEGDAGADGFISLLAPAHLDFFFVRPRARGRGAAQALYATFLDAVREGDAEPTTFASHLARRFLEPRGWRVIEREESARGGETLIRFAMRLETARPPGDQAAPNQVS